MVKMSLKILVICLFQLSALCCCYCQELSNNDDGGADTKSPSPFLGDDGQQPSRSGRTFGLGFWNYGLSKGFYDNGGPRFGSEDYFPDESVHRFNIRAPFNSENIGFPTDNDFELGRGSNQPQFPFFYPQFPAFPNFPQQFPFAPLPPLQPIQPNQPASIFGAPINVPEYAPWWKSDNVCVEKDEMTEDWTANEIGNGGNVGGRPDFSINLQSCVEQRNKYVCKTITNRGGKKLTVTETRECCRGFSRFPRRDGPNANCRKVEVLSMDKAASKYSYPAFADLLKQANISSEVLQNSTLLLPLKLKSEQANNNNGTDLETQETILEEDVLEYLIPNRVIELELMENEEQIETQSGHKIRFNVFPRSDETDKKEYDYAYHYTANCVPILKPKIFTGEGTIIGLKEPLIVPEDNLMEVIRGREELTMFSRLLEKANLTEFLESEDAVTVLAPSDEAFARMEDVDQRALLMGDRCATEYIKNHLIGLTFCSSAVVKNAKAHVDNVLKRSMTFERQFNDSEIMINQNSNILESDLMATNGVLHVIDAVLPGSPMTAISILKQDQASIFAKLLEASGLTDQLENLQNVTIFAPTDKAMKDSMWNVELEKNPQSLKNNETLRRFLLNHISEGIIGAQEFRTGLVPTKAKELLKLNIVHNDPRASTLQCGKLVKIDGLGCNSVVHLIDRALEAPSMSILEALESTEKYSKFYQLIKAANLTNLFGDEAKDLLVLVPTNDVFQEQKEFYEEILKNQPLLHGLVMTHVVPTTICCSSFPEYPIVNSLHNLNGQSLVISRNRRPSVANVDVTKCDNLMRNGVIFEVNDLIEFKRIANRPVYY